MVNTVGHSMARLRSLSLFPSRVKCCKQGPLGVVNTVGHSMARLRSLSLFCPRVNAWAALGQFFIVITSFNAVMSVLVLCIRGG